MNKPATIDGRAVMASEIVRTNRAKRPPISLRNTAVVIPSGIVMTRAIEIWMSVPTIGGGETLFTFERRGPYRWVLVHVGLPERAPERSPDSAGEP